MSALVETRAYRPSTSSRCAALWAPQPIVWAPQLIVWALFCLSLLQQRLEPGISLLGLFLQLSYLDIHVSICCIQLLHKIHQLFLETGRKHIETDYVKAALSCLYTVVKEDCIVLSSGSLRDRRVVTPMTK